VFLIGGSSSKKERKQKPAPRPSRCWVGPIIYMNSSSQPSAIIKSTQSGFVIATLFAVAEEPSRPRSRNRKWMGEVAESAFLWKAMQLGLLVAKPWGDSARYDFIVDSGGGLLRVQVKSTGCLCEEHRYAVAAHGSNPAIPYTKDDIDFLVALHSSRRCPVHPSRGGVHALHAPLALSPRRGRPTVRILPRGLVPVRRQGPAGIK
jgi:hypothetical protein